MTKTNTASKDKYIFLFILGLAVWRVLMTLEATRIPEIGQFTAVGAMVMFGGAYLSKGKGMLFPLAALWISDLLVNRFFYFGEWILFYDEFLWTYGAFALIALAGNLMMKKKNLHSFLTTSLVAVLIHWIITDIGTFIHSGTYPHTIAGFWACLVAAIPFEKNLLIGTLAYGGLMFGSFEYMKTRIPGLKPVTGEA